MNSVSTKELAEAIIAKQQSRFQGANKKAVTGIEEKIRDCNLSVARDLEAAGILRNVKEHEAALIVEEDDSNVGQFNSALPTHVVPGLHVFANKHIVML